MANSGYIVCLAYLAGLLLSGLPHGGLWGAGTGALATLALPWVWRQAPPRQTLAIATVVSVIAAAYLHLRTPAPTLYNVSQWVTSSGEESCVSGTLHDAPQMTRRGQLKVQLNATYIQIFGSDETGQPQLSDPVAVDGRLYVTLPLLQGTGLYPTQSVRACGQLYAPAASQNPSGFDFAAYLARQGIFAGLQATALEPAGTPAPPRLWQLRQRIVRAFVEPLGSPKGVLLSAMVLGRRAVDLPYDVRDPFSQAGLAHTLAASGFHVSLLLGLFLAVTQRLSAGVRLVLGTALLVGYAGLTGLQPSICRAVAMGVAALLGSTLERKTRPVGLLLVIAVVILLVNPIWIWDLGFQLSFLATLGLLVTTQPLAQRLDWLPTPVATALAVPMAAIAWTLPIQLWAFNTLSPYSLPLNVVMTPLISLISLVGMADAAIALISPDLASVVARGLGLPIQALMGSVAFVNQLPGQTIALSQSLVQVGLIYSAFGLISCARPRQRLILCGVVVGLLLLPGWWTQRHLVQVTVLAGRSPVIVVQERGHVGVIGDGQASDLSFNLLPFLRRNGVNRVDWAINTGSGVDEQDWMPELPIDRRYAVADAAAGAAAGGGTGGAAPLVLGRGQSFESSMVRLLQVSPAVLDLALSDQHWLIVGAREAQPEHQGRLSKGLDPASAAPEQGPPSGSVLVWSGQGSLPEWLAPSESETTLPLAAAIATSTTVSTASRDVLAAEAIPVHVAGRDGAIQWRPGDDVRTLLAIGVEF